MSKQFQILQGDCLEHLRAMPDCSIDAVVTDPPYGLAFMGKRWDYDVPPVEVWAECLRVLKPGGHLLAFAGTRTQHRMCCRIEDAGFEIREMIAWVYGSGFPKSLDVSKAIDKAAGAERDVVGETRKGAQSESTGRYGAWGDGITPTAPSTDAAKQWQGWGTALKPAMEPITVARKPLIGTVAKNVLAHGAGALNIDGCRVGDGGGTAKGTFPKGASNGTYGNGLNGGCEILDLGKGRWPANLIHDGSDEVVALFPQAGGGYGKRGSREGATVGDYGMGATMETVGYGDTGSAARFFYCAKASKKDRDEGLEGFAKGEAGIGDNRPSGSFNERMGARAVIPSANHHPTVKPTALMRYLCRLVTPPGGVVLDPFAGSGSTGKGAILEGFRFVGIERDPEYVAIANTRISAVAKPAQDTLF